jgi:hypothetical protein
MDKKSDRVSKQSDFDLLRKMKRTEAKGRKSNVSIPQSLKLDKTAPSSISSKALSLPIQIGIVVALLFLGAMYVNTKGAVLNLVNADPEKLKAALTGDLPYLFYCHKGGKDEVIPKIFTELNSNTKSTKMGFALVNCSQVLPSGKNLFDRFKLNQNIRPTMFETAPWAKPTQVPKKDLKDVTSLKKFVDQTMGPKGVEVITDKDLMKACGFNVVNKSAPVDTNSRGETCFVFVKGAKYTKGSLEERIIRANPKAKIATVDAVKRRLSFENPEAMSADMFDLKVHALRNGTHYMSMVNPPTWDYVSTFMSTASSSPSYSYTGDYKSPVKLIKTGSSAFKSRTAASSTPNSQPTSRKSKQSTEKKTTTATGSKTPVEEAQQKQETVAEKFAREKRRRDEMERQSREQLFENSDSQNSADNEDETEESAEDDDENIIEL